MTDLETGLPASEAALIRIHEPVPAPEVKRPLPVVDMFWADHDRGGIEIPAIREKLSKLLEANPKGTVVYFIENASLSASWLRWMRESDIPQLQETGAANPLTDSHLRAYFYQEKDRLPENAQELERYKKGIRQGNSFFIDQLEMLDELVKTSGGRLRLVEENIPDGEYGRRSHMLDQADAVRREVVMSMMNGNIIDACDLIKQALLLDAEIERERARPILTILSDIPREFPEGSVITGAIGRIHATPIARFMGELGFQVAPNAEPVSPSPYTDLLGAVLSSSLSIDQAVESFDDHFSRTPLIQAAVSVAFMDMKDRVLVPMHEAGAEVIRRYAELMGTLVNVSIDAGNRVIMEKLNNRDVVARFIATIKRKGVNTGFLEAFLEMVYI